MKRTQLYYVSKKFTKKKAAHIALKALQASEYLYLFRITEMMADFWSGTYVKPRLKDYWIYEFGKEQPTPMPSYHIWRDGTLADGSERKWSDL